MKYFIQFLSVPLILFLSISCKHKPVVEAEESLEQDYEKRLNAAEKEVDRIMEMMDLPEYGLVKMANEDLYLSKDFLQAATDMIKHGREMEKVDYPGKKFRKLSQNMLDAFKSFESALKTKNKEAIKEEWLAVHLTCKKCHDIYD